MNSELVENLLKSFDELEQCIELTKEILKSKNDTSEEVLSRLEDYRAIVSKQRTFALALKEHITENNWDEVTRHIRLINGLSVMIRDDAYDIISGTAQEVVSVEEEQLSLN